MNRWIVCRETEQLSCPSPRTSALPDIRVNQERPFQHIIDFNRLFKTKAQKMGLKDEEVIQSIDYFRRARSPGTQFVFTDPGPQFVFTGPGPQFVFTGHGPKFVFTKHDL